MRILFIGLNATGVGTYWRMFHFARHLVKQGHAVTILCMGPQQRLGRRVLVREGVRIVEVGDLLWGPLRSGWDLGAAVNRIGWLRGEQFDLIHAFETRPTVLFPALYGRYVQKTTVFFDWCDWFGRGGAVEERPSALQRVLLRSVDTFFEERFRQQAQGTTVICNFLKTKAQQLGVSESTIQLIRDGCSVDEFQPLDKCAARRQLGLSEHAPVVGYIGAIFQRDAELLAAAFDQLQQQLPAARLLLIGYVNRPIKEMVRQPDSVIETKRIPFNEINLYLAACDLCWLPYLDTGANQGRWPMKFNDYMAVGRPTVATAVGDVPAVMNDVQVGRLTSPHSEAIAAATAELLADDEQLLWLGQNARRVAEEQFSWEIMSQQLFEFYQLSL